MNRIARQSVGVWLFWGGLNGFLAVALGAFGAHSLKERLGALNTLAVWQTASHYHVIHAVALLVVALLAMNLTNTRWIRAIGWLFLVGILLFAGSLYALALTGVKVLGAITPFGGLCFLAGWILILLTGVQNMKNTPKS